MVHWGEYAIPRFAIILPVPATHMLALLCMYFLCMYFLCMCFLCMYSLCMYFYSVQSQAPQRELQLYTFFVLARGAALSMCPGSSGRMLGRASPAAATFGRNTFFSTSMADISYTPFAQPSQEPTSE